MGSRLEGLDFSNEGVKRVVGLFMGFVSVIASAPYRFFYLKQRIHDYKKEKKEKKRKKALLFPHAPRPLHLQSLKSQLHVVQCTIPPHTLSPLRVRLRVPDPPSPRWTTFLPFPPRVHPRVPPLGSPRPLSSLSPTFTFAILLARPAKGLTSLLSNF